MIYFNTRTIVFHLSCLTIAKYENYCKIRFSQMLVARESIISGYEQPNADTALNSSDQCSKVSKYIWGVQ